MTTISVENPAAAAAIINPFLLSVQVLLKNPEIQELKEVNHEKRKE